MPILVLLIVLSFAFYIFYKVKYVRSKRPAEKNGFPPNRALPWACSSRYLVWTSCSFFKLQSHISWQPFSLSWVPWVYGQDSKHTSSICLLQQRKLQMALRNRIKEPRAYRQGDWPLSFRFFKQKEANPLGWLPFHLFNACLWAGTSSLLFQQVFHHWRLLYQLSQTSCRLQAPLDKFRWHCR